MLRKITAVFLISICAAGPSFAYTFQEYKWGEPLDYVRSELEYQGQAFTWKPAIDTLLYYDVIFDERCEVSMVFLPTERTLASMALMWEGTSVFEKIIRHMTRQYGEPRSFDREKKKNQIYIWENAKKKNDRIILKKEPKAVVLGYYGGEHYSMYLKEKKQQLKYSSGRKRTYNLPSFYGR